MIDVLGGASFHWVKISFRLHEVARLSYWGKMNEGFPDTRWTLIQRARNESGGLDEWCRGYWRPVRDYVQAQGFTEEEAGEMTQRFFEKLMERGPENILPEKLSGIFRAYLKRSVKNFLHDVGRAKRRQKRGGGLEALELKDDLLESGGVNPDVAFEQAWVLTLMEKAMATLEKEMRDAGKGDFFEKAAGCLDGQERGREALAQELGMTDGAFRVGLYRLRKRFRHLIEEELRETVSTREEFEEEVRYLLSVWA